MIRASDAFDGKCPNCGHHIALAELKRMAVGDGWQRYLAIAGVNGKPAIVSFDEYCPDSMELFTPKFSGQQPSADLRKR
jgi:hypothetical protein